MEFFHKMGWEPFFSQQVDERDETITPARIIEEQKGLYKIALESGDLWAEPSGRLHHDSDGERPAVGDWVLIDRETGSDRPVIRAMLRRKSLLSRGRGDAKRNSDAHAVEQVLAANVDTAFIAESLSGRPNSRRIDRYMALAHGGGVWPVVLLTKADLAEDPEEAVREVERRAPGVDVIPVSAVSATGFDRIAEYTGPGKTVVLLGPSGTGKSTLINGMLGREELAVGAVRDSDGKGRHTTTSRHLFRLPQGGMIIDTPGLRAVGLAGVEDGVSEVFAEIEETAGRCRFRDCTHQSEPGCAVQKAVENGVLDRERLENYLALRREAEWFERRNDTASQRKEGRRMAKRINEVKLLDKRKFERR